MKKYILLPVCLFFIVLASVLIYERINSKTPAFKPLLERSGAISVTSEWKNTKASILSLQDQIRKKPGDLQAKLMLALAYMQEARITGEHPYYYPAALELLEQVLDKDPDNALIAYEALVAKSSVLLSLHQFNEAKEIGKKALELNIHSASVYGILCDANVELGQYDSAIAMADKMVSIRPDIRSYARVSYLREIFGDLNGAIEAMKLAVSAGYPGLEQTAWTRTTLGHLYEQKGDLVNADLQYRYALAEYPNYAFAIGGLAGLEAKKNNLDASVKMYMKAGEILPEFSFQQSLAKLFKEKNEVNKEKKTTEKLLAMLQEDAEAGHDVDLELANVYINIVQDYDKALEYAMNEYQKRPDNIDVCKALAHIYYKKADLANAEKFIRIATRTKRQEPYLLCLEGLIDIHSGKKAHGQKLIEQSFSLDPFQMSDLSLEGKKYLPPGVAMASR